MPSISREHYSLIFKQPNCQLQRASLKPAEILAPWTHCDCWAVQRGKIISEIILAAWKGPFVTTSQLQPVGICEKSTTGAAPTGSQGSGVIPKGQMLKDLGWTRG
ncbi:uncharacterized protein [Diadema antillarum]|uniref:uncharacterized protein n=1 Tax=Diadema antillarum TaxID=105358 RepID=UPI003A89B3B6